MAFHRHDDRAGAAMKPSALTFLLLAAAAVADPPPERVFFSRVFPVPGQIGLFIAAADGSDERPLLASPDLDYNPAWSPDGAWLAFTSERDGSADLYRVRPDGTDLERLTDSPAFDDQAAFSPDGRQIVFVTSRAGGTADLWLLDVQTRRATALTSGAGGDFRPAWSPDGTWIAFSSDRGSGLPFAHGRWEHLHLVDIYLIHPDGSGLKRSDRAREILRQPEVVRRQPAPHHVLHGGRRDDGLSAPEIEGGNTSLVSIDIVTGAATDVSGGPGVKIAPVFLPSNEIAFIRKDAGGAGIHYASGKIGPKGDLRSAAWSPDGTRVAFHKRLPAAPRRWPQDVEPPSRLRAAARRHAAVVSSVRRPLRDDELRADAGQQQPSRGGIGQRQVDHRLSSGRPQRARAAVVGARRRHRVRHRQVRRVLQRVPRSVPEGRRSRRRRGADCA